MSKPNAYAGQEPIQAQAISIGERSVGSGQPVYIVAEIGINHNGCVDRALELVDCAVQAGCDAVKFQKRSPMDCVPVHVREVERETPWGRLSYLEYRQRMEFDAEQYDRIDRHCRQKEITWFASCWDLASVDFMGRYAPPCHKIASACLTDHSLLAHIRDQGVPVIVSTGMSTMQEIQSAVSIFDRSDLLVVHTTSNYAGDPSELNLAMIHTLRDQFCCSVGYSGHEIGFVPTVAAVAMGACYVERHITLDRTGWGSDQTISLEPKDLATMVAQIRLVEQAMGDGVKRVYESERAARAKLRNHVNRACEQV